MRYLFSLLLFFCLCPFWVFGEPLQLTTFDGHTVSGETEDVRFFEDFPYKKYKIYHVGNLGSFYLDKIDDCIKNCLRKGIQWEKQEAALLQQYVKPSSIALDIGAHIGTHTLTLSKAVGTKGTVIAFEPQKKIYSELVQNLLLNQHHNVIAYRCAVGEENKMIEMDKPIKGNEGATGIGHGGCFAPMITLDSLNLTNVSLMKIDVEDYEMHVLNGAIETIVRNKPVIHIEILGNNIYAPLDPEKATRSTIKKLEDLNYKVRKTNWHNYLAIPIK